MDYINTHGTGTPIWDRAETQALRRAFGKRASKIPATALKSMTGHMLAASGALEFASTLMTIKEDIIPPTINLDEKDPDCDINIITEKRAADIRFAISNSFGFGVGERGYSPEGCLALYTIYTNFTEVFLS